MRHQNSTNYRWELEYIPEGRHGHAYYWDTKSQPHAGWRYRLACADQSGRNPEETDDGILYVDFSRSIMEVDEWDGIHYYVPLVDTGGRQTKTVVSRLEACCVAERFKMQLTKM